MQKWTNFFDKIFVVSLPDCKATRLINVLHEFNKYGIDVEYFDATLNIESGAVGLRDTMIRLFRHCLENGFSKILIFEDDVEFINDINYYMPLCLEQLPANFDLFYLGAYVVKPFKARHSENILKLNGALTTHAVAYSKKVMQKILPLMEKHSMSSRDKTTVDMLLMNKVVCLGNSYISYPLLAKQRSGYSEIEKREVNYDKYIEDQYNFQLQKLNTCQ